MGNNVYEKVCLVGPERGFVNPEQVSDAIDMLRDKAEVLGLLAGDPLSAMGDIVHTYGLENSLPCEFVCVVGDQDQMGATRQLWDFHKANPSLFVFFGPMDTYVRNAMTFAQFHGYDVWVPYE